MKPARSLWPLLFLATACAIPTAADFQHAPDIVQPDNPFEPKDNYVAGDGDAPGFAVTTVTPAQGPIAGGTRVQLAGVGFLSFSKVVFGSSEGVDVVVENDGSITVTTPPHPAGPVAVTVQRPSGATTTLADGFFYTTDIAVDSVDPATGPSTGGTPITLRGAGFNADTKVVIGGHLAVSSHVLDPATLIAVTPPGTPGPRDVLIVNAMGSAVRRKGFAYVVPPAIARCTPAVVPTGTTTLVTVSGTGLGGAGTASATGAAATLAGASGADAVRVQVTPTGAGPIGFTVTTGGGVATQPSCLFAADPASIAGTAPRVLGIIPSLGDTDGGLEAVVAMIGNSGNSAGDLQVLLGATAAEVLAIDDGGRTVRIRVPAHAEGLVDCAVHAPGGTDTLADAFRYVAKVTLTSVVPDSGPPEGGTVVTVSGTHLDQVTELRIGPLPAPQVQAPTSIQQVVRTAPANPGRHDVTALVTGGGHVILPGAFTFGAVEPDLVAVAPASGSMAGNTLVSIVGSGFSTGCRVYFGTLEATYEDSPDPARLGVRTPQATAGQVDVTVVWADGTRKTLPRAFTYFDPTGYFGGVWGDAIDGAVNVTVLDSYNGKPIWNAFVILGSDTATPYRGTTDLRGQLTLSGDDLFGPLQATASRGDYSTFTLAGVDAENVTLFLDPIFPTSEGGGGTGAQHLPPGTVAGHVLESDKYLLTPPGSCADQPLVHGALCRPCTTDGDCGGAKCLDLPGGGRYCATSCVGPSDCPDRYACLGTLSSGNACVPVVGNAEVHCATTATGLFSSALEAGPGTLVAADHQYALNSRLGDVAIYCVGGVRRYDDATFEPLVLGIQRHVPVYPALLAAGRDITLDILLDRDLDVRLVNAPGGPNGPDSHTLLAELDLGSDGLLRLWPQQVALDQDHFVVHHLPRVLAGPLADATYTFYAEANSQTPTTIPYSVSMIRNWVPGGNNRVLKVGAARVTSLDPVLQPDASGGCALPDGGGIVFGPGGRAYRIDGAGAVSPMPSLATHTLRACAAAEDGSVIAVGDLGTIVRYDGSATTAETSPTPRALYAIARASDGSAVAAGDGVLLQRDAGGTWTRLDPKTKAPLRAVVVAADGSAALVVGDGGVALRVVAGQVLPVSPYPTSEDLLAAAPYGPGALVVGAHGSSFVASFAGDFKALAAPTDADLRALATLPDGTLVAAGSVGTFLRLAWGLWSSIPAPGFDGEVTVVFPGDDGAIAVSSDVVAVGPFLHLTNFLSPPHELFWNGLTIAWNRDGPPLPSFSYTRLSGAKGVGDWVIVADGPIESVTLPDLWTAAGLQVLSSGQMDVRSTQVLMDHFSLDSFDGNAFSMDGWRSWTVEEFTTRRP